MITREVLVSRLRDYLQHRITRAALVDWAERAVMDEEFDVIPCLIGRQKPRAGTPRATGSAGAILQPDDTHALNDAVDRAVEHPVEQDARDLAGEPRVAGCVAGHSRS
jgi:hypothetical protein